LFIKLLRGFCLEAYLWHEALDFNIVDELKMKSIRYFPRGANSNFNSNTTPNTAPKLADTIITSKQ